ncbi:MAG: Holliday junction resolvase RuvX [Cryobacterium sp.]|nr:Holliday junction resolvase RuvX [Cryobacterium sp.]
MTFRPGVRVGVDVGRARVGVALSDHHGMLATPVRTVARSDEAVAEVAALAREAEAVEVVVGHPLSLSGAATASTDDAVAFATALGELTGLPIRLVDERLSTVTAERSLRQTGRDSRSQRPVIDQVAATIILQTALDAERASGNPPGMLIVPDEGS